MELLVVEIQPGLAERHGSGHFVTTAFEHPAVQRTLERLESRGFGLTVLPVEIGRLGRMRKLMVSDNKLAALPPQIGRMTQLTVLRAENNPMYAVPEHVRDRGVAAVKQHVSARGSRKKA